MRSVLGFFLFRSLLLSCAAIHTRKPSFLAALSEGANEQRADHDREDKEDPVVSRKLEIPEIYPEEGHWLTDKAERLLFLPLRMEKGFSLKSAKLLTDGNVILVLITGPAKAEEVLEHEDTVAWKVVQEKLEGKKAAAKIHEPGGEQRLASALTEWENEEADEDVRAILENMIQNLHEVMEKSEEKHTRTTVPLLALRASKSLRISGDARVIRKSFSVKLPGHGVAPHKVFAIRKQEHGRDALYICVPFEKSLTSRGGGSNKAKILHPFKPIPIFEIAPV